MGVSCYPPFLVRNVIRMSRDAVLSPDLHLSIFVMHFVVEKIWIGFAPVQRGVTRDVCYAGICAVRGRQRLSGLVLKSKMSVCRNVISIPFTIFFVSGCARPPA